jgi:predicted nucleotidyltransferase component of viral defense system
MTLNLFEERIRQYAPDDALEQENVLKELLQQCILTSLSRAGFFTQAMFHGGTCLKIFHGLARFSEDLDFLLMSKNQRFSWEPYLKKIVGDMGEFGIKFQVIDRSKVDDAVKKTFIKTDSIGTVIFFGLPFVRDVRKHLRVKLEIDTKPPQGSAVETHFLTFPSAASITTQTLQCGFALKLHALLCRTYDKGRDWYDLVWYVSRRIHPHMEFMKSAMIQSGPWKDMSNISFDVKWLKKELSDRINKIDWKIVRSDVERFLPKREQESLGLWKPDFFLYHVEQIL